MRGPKLNFKVNHQCVFDILQDRVESLFLPAPDEEILPDIYWGNADALFTPAFWKSQVWFSRSEASDKMCAWSEDLREELVACLLGGHGITWDMNAAAFTALLQWRLFDRPHVKARDIARLLSKPMLSPSGNYIRYRFPNRRSHYIAEALRRLATEELPTRDAFEFRQALLTFPGIGFKTASWITRNYLNSSSVAIIDIHVYRAGILMGLFSGAERIAGEYLSLETKYLEFAEAMEVDPRHLDLIIWRTMQRVPILVRHTLDGDRLTTPR